MKVSSPDLVAAVRRLRPAREGRIILPGDAAYDEARTVYFSGIDRRPGAIVRVSDAGEVAEVLATARETGAELAVRGGGHSVAGHGVSDGGLVLDLSPMRSLELDPVARTAWAGGGLTTGEYTVAAAEHGLATGFGDAPSVGIGGLTLGGGVGFLHRKLGLTIDSLLAADAEGIFDHLSASTAAMSMAQFRVLGGAVARVPRDATAFAHRTRGILTTIGAIHEEADQAPEHAAWASSLAAGLEGDGESGAYIGFLGDEGEAGVRRAYPEETWKRLAGIKAIYDPDNLFRLNQNVPPSIG